MSIAARGKDGRSVDRTEFWSVMYAAVCVMMDGEWAVDGSDDERRWWQTGRHVTDRAKPMVSPVRWLGEREVRRGMGRDKGHPGERGED